LQQVRLFKRVVSETVAVGDSFVLSFRCYFVQKCYALVHFPIDFECFGQFVEANVCVSTALLNGTFN